MIETAGFSRLANKAREIFNKRGGAEAAKGDLQELKDIHARGGSMPDKAKAAGRPPGTVRALLPVARSNVARANATDPS